MLSNKFIIVSIICSLAATALSAIVLISISKSSSILKDLDWSHGKSDSLGFTQKVYVGIWAVGSITSGGGGSSNMQQLKYTDDDCTADFCKRCHHDMPVIYGFLAGFCFFSLFSIETNLQRFREAGNTHIHRNSGICTSLITIACGLVSLILFAARCQKQIEKELPDDDYNWKYGTSFILLAAAVCAKAVDILFNVLIGIAGVFGCC